uniref:Uncharacterized protein n=1 Tax=Anguilla anguilla TaxID=7936 RepID=A0A0E9VYV3_ANGAN
MFSLTGGWHLTSGSLWGFPLQLGLSSDGLIFECCFNCKKTMTFECEN